MITYKFDSDPAVLSGVEELVMRFVEKYDVPSALHHKLIVSSLEALSNSIYHGNGCDTSKKVMFILEKQNNRVVVSVEDEGVGFDYSSLPDPTLPENLENPEGRGVFLMLKLSDYAEFNRIGNRVQLYFNI
jgi:serine/threonine-protein kinase RsbW